MKHPELVGHVLSQCGAFWRGNEASNSPPYEWLTNQYASAPKLPLRFFVDVGARETVGALGGSAPSLLDANRRLGSVLRSKGYIVDYYEVPGGQHSPESWRTRLAPGIVALLPLTPPSAPR
jgi:enterochelin esterase family protein